MATVRMFSLITMLSVASSFAVALQNSADACSHLADDFRLPPTDVQDDTLCKNYLTGQCVSYARCRSGYQGKITNHEASGWPISHRDPQKIQPGDVIIYTGGTGHVAYVESVDPPVNGVIKRIVVSEFNYSKTAWPNYPNLYRYCSVSKQYGKVDTRPITNLNEFQAIYHPGGDAVGKLPALRFSSGENISLKAGETTQITGVNFVQGSRVVLLQQAPGAPELILANLNADTKGTIQWNYQSTCNSKNGKYVIRALDQPLPGAAPGTKSNSVTISIDGRSSNCSSILGINTAQASNQGGASAQSATGAGGGPSLDSVSPTNHPPGQFGIDLYGNGFQQGAKVVAQGSDWNSDKAAVTFLGSNHLRAIIVASNPGQFVVTVRNPDGQVSASRSFDVIASNTPLTKGTTATTPNRGQPIGNNSNSTIMMAPNPGSNGTNPKPPVSGAADSKSTNSSTGSTVSSQGGLQSPLSNSAGRVTLANPPTSTISDTSKKQVPNTPKPAIVGAPAQGSGSGSANAVQRINIPPSNTHSADQTGSSFKNTQAKPMITNGQQPTSVLPRNSGQTLPTGTHNQTVLGQPVTTAVHPEPKRQDIPKTQASPQHSGATPIVHPPTPVPPTTTKPAPVQNTQLPRGPSPIVNAPPQPKPMPPSPQPSSTPANQKSAPPPAKPPSQNQSNDKKKP